MQESKPVAQIEASLSHHGEHYFCRTGLDLNGRGITFLGVSMSADGLVVQNRYKVTEAAFQRLCGQYNVSTENQL